MKIVLFGATGNIGQRIAREAVTRGHTVSGVVRDPARSQTPVPGVALLAGDVTDAGCVADLARDADAVVCAISASPGHHGAGAVVGRRRACADHGPRTGRRESTGRGRRRGQPGGGARPATDGRRRLSRGIQGRGHHRRAGCAGRLSRGGRRAGLDVRQPRRDDRARRTNRHGTARRSDRFLTDADGRSTISFEDYAVAIVDELDTRCSSPPRRRGESGTPDLSMGRSASGALQHRCGKGLRPRALRLLQALFTALDGEDTGSLAARRARSS